MDSFIDRFPIVLFRINIRYFIVAGIAFFIFYVLLKKIIQHQKIQQKWPKTKDYYREVFYSVISMSIFSLIATLTITTFSPYTQLYFNLSDASTAYFLFSILLMVFLHDTYFYWSHRFMHIPQVYRFIHLTHHQSTNPSPWTSYAFHPIEAIIEACIIPLIAIVIPAHPFAIVLFFFFKSSTMYMDI